MTLTRRFHTHWLSPLCPYEGDASLNPAGIKGQPHTFPLPQADSHTHQGALGDEVCRGHGPR